MKKIMICLSAVLCLLSQVTWSHSSLHHSVPAKDAVLTKPPEQITLTFDDSVQLIKLTVIDQMGKPMDLSFKPMKGKELNIPLNDTLKPGVYQVSWMILGADAHKMKGIFNFTLSGG